MSKRIKTRYLGVYEREAKSKKHLGKPDICYDVTYTRYGKKIWEKIGWLSEGYSAKLASTLRAERVRFIRHGEELPSDKKKIPYFKDAAKDFLEWCSSNRAKNGINEKIRYRKHLKPEFENKRLDEISSFDLERLKAKLSKTFAPATVNHILGDFGEIFNKTVGWKNLNLTNPIKKVRLPKPINNRLRFFSREEADQLLEALKKHKQVHDIALLSLRTGLRFKEITGIKGQDLDFKNGIIHVLDPKNDAQGEIVYMTSDIKPLLKAYNTPKHEYVFKDRYEKRVAQISKTFKKTVNRLGYNEGISDRRQILTFHSLRHTFASWLALRGEQLITIKELMRHRDIKQTMKYAHLIPSYKRRAVEAIAKR